GRALVGPLSLVVLAAAAVLLPRPVPRLAAQDASLTVLDYHAHTEASHDGRAGWGLENLARWHARQGFEASYVTDHNRIFPGGAEQAFPLLPGAEWSVHRQHVLALGPVREIVRDSFGRTTERMLGIFPELDRQGAIAIGALPEYWRNHWDHLDELAEAGADGFEIVDCGPKALGFPRAGRTRVVRLAAAHDLLVVGGSDNHGWGAVTCVWNLAVPGVTGLRANRVIARSVALAQGDGPAWAAALTQPWLLFRSLSWSERMSWLTWITVIVLYRAIPRREGDPGGLGILARSLKLRALFRRRVAG
ncbi:MAG: PHP domain-containing protein, partial [Gemmatimonadales bacterium]